MEYDIYEVTTNEQRATISRKAENRAEELAMRRTLTPVIGGDGAIAVFWRGMYLCIEPDGYCHT